MSWAAKQQTLAIRLRQTSIQEYNAACPLEKMTRNGGGQPGGGLLSLVPIVDVDSHLEQIGMFETMPDLSGERLGEAVAPQGQLGLQLVASAQQYAAGLSLRCRTWIRAGAVGSHRHGHTIQRGGADNNVTRREASHVRLQDSLRSDKTGTSFSKTGGRGGQLRRIDNRQARQGSFVCSCRPKSHFPVRPPGPRMLLPGMCLTHRMCALENMLGRCRDSGAMTHACG